MRPLAGKVVAVLGASRGIGAAAARLLAEDGATVLLAARDGAALAAQAAGLRADGLAAEAVALDVTDAAAVEDALAAVQARHGSLDGVVNNAGLIDPVAHLADTDPDAWARCIAVTLTGTYHGCRAAVRLMKPQGGGVIVNLSSGAAHRPVEGWSAYCAAKAGARALTAVLALETAGSGIRVYGFQPGAVDTGMLETVRHAGLGEPAHLPREALLPPELPARVIAWLMRPEAADLAGQELTIRDPGLRARVALPERAYD